MARVLLVDDHPDTREVLAQLLSLHGHRVDTCVNGEEALQSVSADPPDALICDDRLPGMSGLELLQTLRGDRRYLDMQVIITSAADHPRDAALEAGANEFWLKGSSTIFEMVDQFGERLKHIPARM